MVSEKNSSPEWGDQSLTDHNKSQESSFFDEFARSALHSGIQAPIDALVQIGGYKAPQIFAAPAEVEYGSSNWYAQQFGAGLGTLPLFALINHKVGKSLGPNFSPIAKSAVSGILFEGLLRPANPDLSGDALLRERGKNALVGAITFASITGASQYSLANGLGRYPLEQAGQLSLRQKAQDILANATRGGISGVFGGMVNVSAESALEGNFSPSTDQMLRSAYSFGIVGVGLDLIGSHNHRLPKGPLLYDMVAQREGRIALKDPTIVLRNDGIYEPFFKAKKVQVSAGDQVLETSQLSPLADGFEFEKTGQTWRCDSNGRVQQILDRASGKTMQCEYRAEPSKSSQIMDFKVVDPSGRIEPTQHVFWLEEAGWYANGKGTPLGTRALIGPDGALHITGEGKDQSTTVGSSVSGSPQHKIWLMRVTPEGSDQYFGYGRFKFNALDHLTQVQTPEGSTDYAYGPEGKLSEISFPEGRTLKLQDGIWRDNSGAPFATDIEHTEAARLFITPVESIRSPRYPTEPVKRMVYDPVAKSTLVYFDGAVPAPLDHSPVPPVQSQKEILDARIARGEITQRDGNWTYTGYNAERVTFDRDGAVSNVLTKDKQNIRIHRDSNGEIGRLEFANELGTYFTIEKTSDGWQKLDCYGQPIGKLAQVEVHLDGSITLLKDMPGDPAHWTGSRIRPDGVTVAVNELGHETIDAHQLRNERARVVQLLSEAKVSDAQIVRFRDWMFEFERRASRRVPPVSDFEVANSYYQIGRLLTSEQSLLPKDTRLKLAEQFMFKAAYPHTIGQGPFNTCNVTAFIENRFVTKFPSTAMRIVTDVATTGRTTTKTGHVLDMTQIKNALSPYDLVENSFDATRFSGRDYFDQILQNTAVNTYWQTNGAENFANSCSTIWDLRSGKPYQPGDVRYELSRQYAREVLCNYGQETPHILMNFRYYAETDPVSRRQQMVQECRPTTHPDLSIKALTDIEKSLLGFNDQQHIIVSSEYNLPDSILVGSHEDLTNCLLRLKASGAFPATVNVDCSAPALAYKGRSGAPEMTRHVVNVQDIHKVWGQWKVEITNQWGDQFNHLGKRRAIPVEDLWRAMLISEPKPESQPAKPEPTPRNRGWVWLAALDSAALIGLDQDEKARLAKSKLKPSALPGDNR